jgi:catechol 2,3-dioxygenase-like lactoylglutathione lyase family enzyme
LWHIATLICRVMAKIPQIRMKVRDLERARRFYVEALGMNLVEAPNESSLRLTTAGVEIDLSQAEPIAPCAESLIAFASEDITRDRARLEAYGAEFFAEEFNESTHVFLFRDPEGNTLRLVQRRVAPATASFTVADQSATMH